MRTLLLAAALLLAGIRPAPGQVGQGPDLHVVYLERPPYYWTDNGEPKGFLLVLTQRILDRAGVTATWAPHPPNRIIEELRTNRLPLCSIGWFRTAEREAFANFSLPIYRDQPMVLLTTVDKAQRFSRHRTLREVFSDTSLVMAQVASFSYGEAIDRLQRDILVRNLTVSSTQKVLPRLILQDRASYMLVAPEEVPTLLQSAGVDPQQFTALSMDGIPAGNLRYLIFSQRVPESTLSRVNEAVAALTNQDALLNPQP